MSRSLPTQISSTVTTCYPCGFRDSARDALRLNEFAAPAKHVWEIHMHKSAQAKRTAFSASAHGRNLAQKLRVLHLRLRPPGLPTLKEMRRRCITTTRVLKPSGHVVAAH